MTDFNETFIGRACAKCGSKFRFVHNKICASCNPTGVQKPRARRTENYHGSACTKCGSTFRYRNGNCVKCVSEYSDSHRRVNIHKRAMQNSIWRLANSDSIKIRNSNRRALESGAQGEHTKLHIDCIWTLQMGKCAYCNDAATQIDHIVPLTRGGSNWPTNIQGLCKFHNISKKNRTDKEYRIWKGITLNRASFFDLVVICLYFSRKRFYAD